MADEVKIPDEGHIIIRNATGHEFIIKWEELMKEHNDINVVWKKMLVLYDVEFYPPEMKRLITGL